MGLANENFSVRWTGQVEPQYSEQYTFYLTNDDGAVLVLEARPVVAFALPYDWIAVRRQVP